jgi:diaminopimelate epimerase
LLYPEKYKVVGDIAPEIGAPFTNAEDKAVIDLTSIVELKDTMAVLSRNEKLEDLFPISADTLVGFRNDTLFFKDSTIRISVDEAIERKCVAFEFVDGRESYYLRSLYAVTKATFTRDSDNRNAGVDFANPDEFNRIHYNIKLVSTEHYDYNLKEILNNNYYVFRDQYGDFAYVNYNPYVEVKSRHIYILSDDDKHYFNSDGKESTMCGNGGRCLAAFAKSLNIVTKDVNFIATDGPHKAIVNDINSVSLQMKDVDDLRIVNTNYFIDTGSPHYVTFRDDISNIDVYKRGKEIRNSGVFAPKGTNVNFVEIQGEKLFVRTYERGVEDETLACGTGVTAAAISASFYTDNDKNSYDIITKGGNLKVSFKKQNDNTFTDIWLTGSATFVFKGEIDI